ncbi:hypothetical protein CCR91_09535 [Thiorhodovibrio winogradskyi]|nr:hypothetical protein [Thiorhodovibrio winogradskyi]
MLKSFNPLAVALQDDGGIRPAMQIPMAATGAVGRARLAPTIRTSVPRMNQADAVCDGELC